jgi:hypothetical protein
MKLLTIIDILTPFMALAVLIGFASCVVSLLRAMGGRRKIPYVSGSFLLVPLVFFFLSHVAIVKVLDEELSNEEIRVTVSPPIVDDPKRILQGAISNLYQWKGSSGTHPSDEPYFFEVCSKGDCFVATVAQDSGDSSMYWVSYESSLGISVSLGYTQLANEKI